MLSALLDTSTDELLLALFQEGKLLTWKVLSHNGQLDALFFSSLEDLLSQEGLSKQDLTCLHVGIGPGSYTGVRVGVAIARGLSLALSIPLYTFPSPLARIPKECPEGLCYILWVAKHTASILLQTEIHQDNGLSLSAITSCQIDELEKIIPQSASLVTPLSLPHQHTFFPSLNLPLLLTYLHALENLPPPPFSILYPETL